MKRITREELVYVMSPANPAVEGVDPGEEIIFETAGSSSATGPVAVLGAKPGDTLVVEILEITGWEQGGSGIPGAGRPSIRFIGVAPEKGKIPLAPLKVVGESNEPDSGLIAAGTRINLPVHVPGANLAVGTTTAAVVRVRTALARSFS
ncbi:MAG: hypothetical protein ACM3TT_06525 [Syntrophothermus sp.]